MTSPASRWRGLKLIIGAINSGIEFVASFTLAWIETPSPELRLAFSRVASFTLAWIETVPGVNFVPFFQSPASRWRGLKQVKYAADQLLSVVASFTLAWIETMPQIIISPKNLVASFTLAWIETAWPETVCVRLLRCQLHAGVD